MPLLTLLAAAAGGWLAERFRVPGGLIFGSMLGAAAVSLASGRVADIPEPVRAGAFIVVGAAIGSLVTRESLGSLQAVAVPALLSAVLIIGAGLGIAFLMRALGFSIPGDVLATSPGALSVVTSMAIDQQVGQVEVATFHLVRVVLVILSLPVLAAMLPRGG